MQKISFQAKMLVISIHDITLRTNQVQAVMRFVTARKRMCAAQDQPQFKLCARAIIFSVSLRSLFQSKPLNDSKSKPTYPLNAHSGKCTISARLFPAMRMNSLIRFALRLIELPTANWHVATFILPLAIVKFHSNTKIS